MQRDAIHLAIANVLEADVGPTCIPVACSRSYFIYLVVGMIAHIGRILAELVRIILRSHVTATAPCLIANTDILHLPWLLTSILATELCPCAVAIGCHVLDPV